jgi:DNA-binding HxlR family transcriptional regulator
MKTLIDTLDRVLENRVRLAVMSLLVVRETMDFTGLKTSLNLTDGNLSAHMNVLERQKYIVVRKRFVGRKPATQYSVTETGRRAFSSHIDTLERLIVRSRKGR